jgi:hypothetical protein
MRGGGWAWGGSAAVPQPKSAPTATSGHETRAMPFAMWDILVRRSAMLASYPSMSEVNLDLRPDLHPLFRSLGDGISEFTFAGIYLFRLTYHYRVALLEPGSLIIGGRDRGGDFFMLPGELPGAEVLAELFAAHSSMKAVSVRQVDSLRRLGYELSPDRDNFDYLYLTRDLATLPGPALRKQRNRVNAFMGAHTCHAKPLLAEDVPDALEVLERWRREHGSEGDYGAARTALEQCEALGLCGGIYHVDGEPAAYVLGEEIAGGNSFVVVFEKAARGPRGLYQFINLSFARILPEQYRYINRQQDLGDPGLRRAKLGYRPHALLAKYRARPGVTHGA